MAETHICPTCSQECAYKTGIMCTIQGCIKDGTANTNNIFDFFNNINNKNNSNSALDKLRSVFGM